jgi:hypothetical protein
LGAFFVPGEGENRMIEKLFELQDCLKELELEGANVEKAKDLLQEIINGLAIN